MRSRRRRAGAGFTLFEVLGVILITAILLGVAVNFYIDLSSQAARASENTREVRRASALLDRVAGDLEHALLVRKPEETDPLAHPWLFVGESRYGLGGADQLMFVRRERPRSREGPASDLAVVAYTLGRDEDGAGFTLRRWSRPDLPEGLERDLPLPDDPDALLVSDEIERFAVRFLDELGEWREDWDSTQLVESSELPIAVEVEVALRNPEGETIDADGFAVAPPSYVRLVQLPMRPIDLEQLLDPGEEEVAGAGGEGEDGECQTVAFCVDLSQVSSGSPALAGLPQTVSDTLNALAQNPDACFDPYADLACGYPGVNPACC